MNPKTNRKRPHRAALVLSLCAIASGAARAGETDPTLLITRAISSQTASGIHLRIDAAFPWNALIQSGYPLQLLVWTTSPPFEFARFEIAGTAHRGVDPIVEHGITTAEASLIKGAGVRDASHRLTLVGEGRLDAMLAAPFAQRALAAQLFVIDEGTPFVSNPATVVRGGP